MRANTHTHIAIRNIGDSQDTGEFYSGTVSEAILWVATKISKMSMATRIVIGMGRSKEDAARGIEVLGAGKAALNDDMKAMLESVFAGGEETDVPAAGSGSEIPADQPKRVIETNVKHSADDDYVA
jgi:hypothetical protein